jgi:hypothetical protein
MPNTGTLVQSVNNANKDLHIYSFECTAATSAFSYTTMNVMGYVYMIVIVPDGTTHPLTAFNLVLLDGDGVDIAGGVLTSMSLTAPAQYVPMIGSVYGARRCEDPLIITLSGNSQASAMFLVKLYVKPPENLFQ